MVFRLVDPTASEAGGSFEEALRPRTLDGARIAFLANGKTHGELLLETVAEQLRGQYSDLEFRYWTKPHPSSAPTQQQLDEIHDFATVVITAIGDCGSCSSCSVFDAMHFEQRNIPCAVVISSAFIPTVQAIARVNGAESFRVTHIEHPVTSRSKSSLIADAERITPELVDILLRGHEKASGQTNALQDLTRDGVEELLEGFRAALNNDGTDIEIDSVVDNEVTLKLVTRGAECSDCVLPASMIQSMVANTLSAAFGEVEVSVADDRVADVSGAVEPAGATT